MTKWLLLCRDSVDFKLIYVGVIHVFSFPRISEFFVRSKQS